MRDGLRKENTWSVKNMKVKSSELSPLKPFLSVFFIISSLFIVVFSKMEERRLGYSVLKLTREQRVVIEEKRIKSVALAKQIRPQHVERVAQDRFTLKKIQNNQIIHLMGGGSQL
jgi:hypothetical protein